MKDKLEERLRQKLSPELLQVTDESHMHAGHVGNPDGSGETHFKVVISADAVSGKNRLEKHRKVIDELGELMGQIHALNIEMK